MSAANIMLGGAKDAKIDGHTEDVAKFAVTQLNAKANFPIQGTLKLGKIVSAKTQVRGSLWLRRVGEGGDVVSAAATVVLTTHAHMQVVSGINHILHLETSDDAGRKEVEVTVWEKLPANVQANESPLQLTANKLVGGPVAEVRAGTETAWCC